MARGVAPREGVDGRRRRRDLRIAAPAVVGGDHGLGARVLERQLGVRERAADIERRRLGVVERGRSQA